MPQWHVCYCVMPNWFSPTCILLTLCTGQPGSAHLSGRDTPESNNNANTTSMLPDLDVQASSKTSLCANPLSSDTTSPIEQPFMTHRTSQELDHEAVDSSSQAGLVHPDDLALNGQYSDGIGEPSELAPVGPSDGSAPCPPSHSEDAVTLTISQQGEIYLRVSSSNDN